MLKDHHFLPVFILCGAVLLILSFFLVQPHITGKVIVAQGGQITQVDITIAKSPSIWVGMYGNISNSSNVSNSTLTGQQVLHLDLPFDGPTHDLLVVAALASNPDWANLNPASTADLDSFLGVGSGDQFSGSNTFTGLENFSIDGTTYELWSATVQSINGTYVTGVLDNNGSLLFVTKTVEGGLGFSGEPADYQMILPVADGSSNYSFFVFENDSLPTGDLSCNETFNLSARIGSDNSSVEIDWSDLAGADEYDIVYVDGPSQGYLNWSSATTITTGSNSEWLDSSQPQERYYRIRAISGSTSCVSNETVGTMIYNLSPSYNLISFPFSIEEPNVSDVMSPIDGKYTTLYEYDNNRKGYDYYIISGQNIFKRFDTIKAGRGYWIIVTENVSLPVAGKVNGSMNSSLSPSYNLQGFITISNNQMNDTVKHVLSSIDGNYTTLYEYDNNRKGYDYYIISGQNIFKRFDTIKAGRGYWIIVTNPVQLEYAND